ncbi:MAG: hypothetical protein PHF43_06465 [Bacteroidales bacterium]|nr:hypothetical protein [Bacteroidales bacterium]
MDDQKSQMAENPRFVLKKKLRCGQIVPGKKVRIYQIQTTVGLAGNVERRKDKGHGNLINLENGILPWGELPMPLSSIQ